MKSRHMIHLDPALSQELKVLSAKPGMTLSSIVSEALRSYIRNKAADPIEQALRLRLDRQGRTLERIERNLQIALESIAAFVHLQLTQTAHLPEPDKVARSVGQKRFNAYIAMVGQQVGVPAQTLTKQVTEADHVRQAHSDVNEAEEVQGQ